MLQIDGDHSGCKTFAINETIVFSCKLNALAHKSSKLFININIIKEVVGTYYEYIYRIL